MSRRKHNKRARPPAPSTGASSSRSQSRWSDVPWSTARGVAALVGAGYALLACGYVASMQTLMDASPQTFRYATAILLFATALGPRLPRWIVLTVVRRGRDANSHRLVGRRAGLDEKMQTLNVLKG